MRIGVVSDTHNNLKNVARIVELFNEAAVERVIHTGDISQPKTLDVLAGLNAPLHGVFGNNDEGERDALISRAEHHGFDFIDPPYELTWHNRSIIVVHDPLELEGTLHSGHELVLHGHTHRLRNEVVSGQLLFNPGECAGHMKGLNAIGVVDLEALEATLIKF